MTGRPMNITFCLPVVGIAGGVRVVGVYAKALLAMGHRVVLVSPPPPQPSWKQRLRAFVTRTPLPAWMLTRNPPSLLDGLGLDHRVLDRHRPIEDRDVPDADVVVATWWETAEWVHALAPSKGAKVYFIQHHEVFPHLPVERSRATYRLPMHKIVIAQWLRDVMRTEYGDDDVDLVPNSVDREQFFAPPRGKQPVPTVGFMYSTAAFKGVDITLAALALVRQRVPALRIVCFGHERMSPELPLPAGAELVHSPRQDRIRDLYAQCDAWVTASRSEGFNLPALEAMACRTPVVSSRTGWPAEAVVSGDNGFLVEVEDAAGLADALGQVLSMAPDRWRAMSERAHATASRGSWEQSAIELERSLARACTRRRDLPRSPQDHA
jgi:glycosyltransferase involved in cell wall biosynthesis